MPETRMPVYFQQLIEDRRLTTPVGKMGEREVLPLENKLPLVRSNGPCLKTASCHDWAGSASGGMRSISDGFNAIQKIPLHLPIGATSFISMPAGVGIGVGLAGMYDRYKDFKRATDIKDTTGQGLAVLGGTESGMLAMGSGAVVGLKGFSAVQEVGLAVHHPMTFTGGLAAVQGGLSWASSITLGLYYVLNGVRLGFGLVSWYQGRQWRQELLKADDPVQALYQQLKSRTEKIDISEDEAIALALKAGARWLEKVEAASGGKLKIQDKEAAFKKLVLKNPQLIRDLIGEFSMKLTGKGELIRFGQYMAQQNECAKFEAECTRKLGAKAVEAMKANDTVALKEALEIKEWIPLALKLGAAVIGLAVVIALAIFISGSPIGVMLVLAGIASLAMIYVSDGKALRDHFASGEFKKRDRAFFYFTLALSVISFVGVVALTIASGGLAPFIVSLVLSGTWLGMNLYSAYMLWKNDHRGWTVQKVVDVVTYRKFLETNPSESEITTIKAKLSVADQAFVEGRTLENLKEQEALLEQSHKEQLDRLIQALSQR